MKNTFNQNKSNNEKKTNVIIVIIFVIIYLLIFIFNLNIRLSQIKEREKIIAQDYEAWKDIDELILKETKYYEELLSKDYAEKKYENPYIFEGFTYVEGEWDTGYVIQDENGNQYVWVPCTNKKSIDIVKLTKKDFIIDPLISYKECYDENIDSYEKFIKSALENGGFYISRYEIGNENETPVSKSNTKIWSSITRNEAIEIINKMYNNINCNLINGYAYDTVLDWIRKTNIINVNNVLVDINIDEINKKEIESIVLTGREKYNNI